MTTHELARKLLEMPDLPTITIYGRMQTEITADDLTEGEATFYTRGKWVTEKCVMIEND